jgi:2-hydroxycyclohexanecarboxyl-CoA dehydrogenase
MPSSHEDAAHQTAGRVALVTGGAGGIGSAICTALAEQRCAIAVADIRLEGATAIAERLHSLGGDALAVELDVCDGASVTAAVSEVEERLGRVDILVNNAGWDELRRFVETDESFWRKVLEINFVGALRLTKALLPTMSDNGFGRVVSIASDAARVGSSGEAVYAGAKGALISFTKSIAREFASTGVTANAVCPGPTDTTLLEQITASTPDAAKVIAAMTRAVPMRRLGRPIDVARAVAFLVSDEASFITGQTLSVSGGLTMV